MAPNSPYHGSVAAARLTPVERALATTLHEQREIARRRGHDIGAPLTDARAIIHALCRFMLRDAMPAEASDDYAVSLACATLHGVAYARFRAYERAGVGAQDALHATLEDIRGVTPGEKVPVPVVPVPDLRADDLVDASDAKARATKSCPS